MSKRGPTKQEQCDAATRAANRGRDPDLPPIEITYDMLRTLKARPDFQEYIRSLEKGGEEAAKTLFVNNMPALVALHLWGAERAREKDDYRAVPLFTGNAIKAVTPQTTQTTQHNITITLGPRAEAALNESAMEVEYEELPPEEPDDGADFQTG